MFDKSIFCYIQNMKLQTKLLLSYLFVVLLPVIFIGYFLVSQTTKETLSQTKYINEINFKQLRNNVNNLMDSYMQLSNNILSDTQLNDYLEKQYPYGTEYGVKYFDFYKLANIYKNKMVFPNLSGINISFYTTNKDILHDGDFIYYLNEEDKKGIWYNEVSAKKGSNYLGAPYNSGNSFIVPMVRLLEFSTTHKYINVLKLDIPEIQLYKLIEKESANKVIYILNNSNCVISSTDRTSIGKKFFDLTGISKSLSGISDIKKTIIRSNRRETVYADVIGSKMPFDECKIIALVSSQPIMKKTYEIIRYSIIICILSMAITIAFVIIFSSKLSSRLKKLVSNMSKIRDGKFDVIVSYEEKDEIGELSRSFKNMIDRINDLISKVYVTELRVKNLEIKSKEAEIHALQSQINPHFLFNSMESIRINLLKKQDLETASIVESFARLLRKSIDWKSDNIPLHQEIELVESYLKIQKFRYRHKLEYEINIDPQYYDNLIPKFAIQPIVENAIYHGIEMKKNGGTLKICTRQQGQTCEIIIEDDGIGMSEDTLMQINESLKNWNSENSSSSIGIINVHQRLCLFFGEEYGLSLVSTKNVGTMVKILIPSNTNERGME